MHNRRFHRLRFITLLALLAAVAATAANNPGGLNLASQPLFGPSVQPNVILAIDDSGSMDFEVLFPTADGALYWPPNTGPLGDRNPAWEDGHFVQDVGPSNGFTYLFPNGITQWTNAQAALDGNAGAKRHDQRVYRRYKAVPPVPYMGFARSPDYNAQYFDPFVSYEPWVNATEAEADSAWFDPAWQEGAIDLTSVRASTRAGELFTMGGWMYMDPDRDWINLTVFDNVYGLNFLDVLEGVGSEDADPLFGYDDGLYDPPPQEAWDVTIDHDTIGDVCVEEQIGVLGDLLSDPTLNTLGACLGWREDVGDIPLAKMGTYAIKYYPATFYLSPEERGRDFTGLSDSGFKDECRALLPQSYRDEDAIERILIGDNPTDDSRICGYRIKPGTDAIANFANWFTYARKRHLAVRGAVLDAFDKVHGLRAGLVTFSQAAAKLDSNNYDTFSMYNLDAATQRQGFYQAVKQLDFTQQHGTPTRQALKYIGELLENNKQVTQYSCQANFAVVLTDGFNRAGADNIGDVDGDGYANTMADVALQYYSELDPARDFPADAPGVPVPAACNAATPPLRLDCNTQPHLNTYAISLGQRGGIYRNPDDDYNADKPYLNPPVWPNPNPDNSTDWPDTFDEWMDWLDAEIEDTFNPLDEPAFGNEQIDDLWHATLNSHGQMFLAQDPQQISLYLTSLLRDMLSSSGSGAAVTVGGGQIYQATFTSYDWRGDLAAYSVGTNGPGTVQWRAAEQLAATLPSERTILTNTAFCSSASPDQADAAAFDAALADPCGLDSAAIAYLRGVTTNELAADGDFRPRYGHVLGDIVHSQPAYVGSPKRVRYPENWLDTLGNNNGHMPENTVVAYTTFARNHANRTPVVYVGANDGMLHGFNAETGDEVLAYIPGVLLQDDADADTTVELAELADPTYSHEPYVDGSPAVGDVVFGNAWHTVLVGGLRGGGQAVYALDVTNPSAFSEDNADDIVLWEFTHPDLGYTYGKPSIVRLHNGKWAAVFANGYNSGSGAQLFVVDIETGTLITQVEAASADGAPNGLAQPAPVDIDGDFIVDYFYAGDLQGNLWKFDLTSADPNAWAASKLIAAEDDADKPQPITTVPVVATHPYGSNYGVMVYFGSGKLLEAADTGPHNPQHSFYGIWDPNVIGSTVAANAKPTTVSRDDDLIEQDIIETTNYNGDIFRVLTDRDVNYNRRSDDGDRGWYIDLIGSGEVMIATPHIRGDVISFSTALPEAAACVPGGSGFIMRVAAVNGGRTAGPSFDASDDGSLSDNDKVFAVPDASADTGARLVAASGMKSQSGRPSAATFVPGHDYVLHNTTSGTILAAPANLPESKRRTWRTIRP